MTDVAAPAPDAVALSPCSTSPGHHAVVTVMKGAVGAHIGISYRANDEGARRHLHLEFHHRLKDDPDLPVAGLWVEPLLDENELLDVRFSARLIAERQQDGRVPYALRLGEAGFDRGGALQLNGSRGLTCATFVMLVFAHAGVELLDVATWGSDRSDERRREDEAAQAKLVHYLMADAPPHALLVEGEIGCTRFRAEEVAAASGLTGHPVPFARAEPEGRGVLGAVHAA